jgi:hypothetical protein
MEILTFKLPRFTILVTAAALLVGCENSTPSSNSPATDSDQTTSAGVSIEELGDQIAALSNSDATELSVYLSDIHGIVSAGQQAPAANKLRQKDSFKSDISTLGDQIASLSLTDSKSLSEYLSKHHNITSAN